MQTIANPSPRIFRATKPKIGMVSIAANDENDLNAASLSPNSDTQPRIKK